MQKAKYLQWVPFTVTLILTVITLAVCGKVTENIKPIIYVQVIATAFIPAILPVISIITKRAFPIEINVLMTIHILLASNLGSAMGFYARFGFWDLLMHGYFGFVAGFILYMMLLRWNGEKLNRVGLMIVIFLGVMGCAALWEIWEYTCDTLLNCDAQRVQEALTLGVSPIRDTMTDIIAAIPGVAVFYIGLFVDKRRKANKYGEKQK